MDRFLRRATAVLLLGLAALVVLERWLGGEAGLFAGDLLMRIAIAVLCVYVLLLIMERHALEDRFRQVLLAMKQLSVGLKSQQAGQAPGDQAGELPEEQKREAVRILVEALGSDAPDLRQTALENLQRLTGEDHGMDPEAWRRAVAKSEKS